LDRRTFLKVSAAFAGAAAVSYSGLGILKLTDAANSSILQDQTTSSTQTSTTTTTMSTITQSLEPMDPALQIPHLLRRASFGASQEELMVYLDRGFDASVDYLLNYDQIDNSQLPAMPNIREHYSDPEVGNELSTLVAWWLDRMVRTNHPLEERMTLFWHNHFATAFSKVQNGYLMWKQNEFLRNNALGNFDDILTGITADGAMLIWLDGNQNVAGNQNENYAREVMEVFSTGRGPYTQDDVVAGAKSFTGFSIDSNGDGVFNPAQHDNTIKTFLGQTGDFGPQDIINILAARPETAANISTELFEYFAYSSPSPETVANLSNVYFSSNYSIKAVVEAILKSPEFISTTAYLANVKGPVEFAATALRSLGATVNSPGAVAAMTNMGQELFNPPSVFGWPSGMGWINMSSVMQRINFPLNVQTTKDNPASALNANAIVGTGTQEDQETANIVNQLFPEGLPTQMMQVIQAATISVSDPSLRVKNALRLAMTSPYYNLN
jgi:uncharacterized protein (DUF1800 family)